MKDIVNIVLIEDNLSDARLIEEYLLQETTFFKRKIISAHYFDLETALKNIKGKNPDVILTDLNLPDSTGMDTFLKLHENYPDIPIIILSGLEDETIIKTAIKYGAQDCLSKTLINANSLERAIYYSLDRFVLTRCLKNEVAAETKFRTIFENTDKIAVQGYNSSHEVIYWNKASESTYGFTAGEAKGNKLEELIIPPFMREGVHKAIEDWIKHGIRIPSSELKLQRKDGSFVDVYSSHIMLKNVNGESEMFCADIDLTDLKKAEETVLQTGEQFKAVWDSSFEAMRLTDENGIIVRVNEAFCKLFDKSYVELEGREFYQVYRDTNDNALVNYDRNFRSRAILPVMETEVTLWNGKKIWVEVTSSFVNLKDQPVLLLSIFRDISRAKNYQQQLIEAKEKAEEMNRLKSLFLANMSHELRTPLIGIIGFSEILNLELKDDVSKDRANIILDSGKRLLETLNQILNLSRIESNKQEVTCSYVNINKTVNDAVKLFEPAAEKKEIGLKVHHTHESLVSYLDENLLFQVIQNLVNNAIKYTSAGNVDVFIEVEKKNSGKDPEYLVVIKVKDTGIGISSENHELIFEPFRQVSEGFNRKYEGSGLGLTITRKFVDLMGGVLELKSEPGKGSEFTVKFKLEESRSKFNLRLNNTTYVNGKPVILYVEDDPVSQQVVRFYVKGMCELYIAGDADEAETMLQERTYNIFLMDINLGGGLNGLELTRRIKSIEQYKDTPIIAVTAYAMNGEKEMIISEGCTHYLSKPYTKNDLQNLLHEVLGTVTT